MIEILDFLQVALRFAMAAALVAIVAFVGSGLLSMLLMEMQRRDELAARERRPWR